MIISKKYTTAFAIFFILYLIPELFFENAMLYLTGGIIGGKISEVLKGIARSSDNYLIFIIWAGLLFGNMYLFLHLKYKPVKYFILVLIALFLYIIDNVLAVMPMIETENTKRALLMHFFIMSSTILLKSIVLTWIYTQGSKHYN